MSVVGPRPHMLKHTEQYSALIDKYMVRHLVKPGVTGWGAGDRLQRRNENVGTNGRTCETGCLVYRELVFLLGS